MVNNETETPRLRGWLTMSVGLVALVLGAVWTLQGLDFLTDHLMSDQPVWAAAGGVVAVIGLVLIVVGMRRRTAGKG
ncbi:uncharacterized membrane protein YdcZ (DUF606 family) [Actinoplanes lutulentus]|uniref:Uncharacterized protein n=1 Tax=Actinoplanes lutulentus TaxID=1287878 RepID=A0A327ZER5_9ACTN|nr:hypothetical protein [Actinoplanes lutulentus]MBB2942902.1 uncharacterized membrane protein YdcZ (DUF606 family) [Actinoplanes lutulentus]RAK38480.1 hypothetical protein B0I29_105428 [Actinoplanes lutulentus]